MNSLELAVNTIAALSMLCVLGVQGYMLGSLMMSKLIEYYDVYMIKKKVPDGLCCCGDSIEYHQTYSSNHGFVSAIEYGIKNAKKWERG